jgi:hypothetical protein
MAMAELLTSPAYGRRLCGGGHQPILFDQPISPLSISTPINLWHPLAWAFSVLSPVCL